MRGRGSRRPASRRLPSSPVAAGRHGTPSAAGPSATGLSEPSAISTPGTPRSMFQISGALPAYEGAIVQIALKRFEDRLRASKRIELDPPDDPGGARKADALAWICEAVLGEPGSTDTPGAPLARVVVHADYDVLTGANPGGRGHLEDGPALSTNMLRRLGCDATLKTLIERHGEAIAAGREKPTVSAELKLRVRRRDGICAYPVCAVR